MAAAAAVGRLYVAFSGGYWELDEVEEVCWCCRIVEAVMGIEDTVVALQSAPLVGAVVGGVDTGVGAALEVGAGVGVDPVARLFSSGNPCAVTPPAAGGCC